jgi:hypothetical protein
MTHRWERRHTNGWLATVVADPDPTVGFTYSARQPGLVSAQWAGHNVDLSLAQEGADAKVPTHRCACTGWVGREFA